MDTSGNHASGWLDRHGTAVALGLAAVVFLAGLGSTGLWDPWEMDRAQLARDLAAPPQAAVALSHDPEGALRALVDQASGEAGLVVRHGTALTRPVRAASVGARSVRDVLDRARTSRVAAVVLDLDLFTQHKGIAWDKAHKHLSEALTYVPSGRVVALASEAAGPPEKVRTELARARLRQGHAALLTLLDAETDSLPGGDDARWDEMSEAGVSPRLDVLSADDGPGLVRALSEASSVGSWTAGFQDHGTTLTVAPLRPWLTAVVYGIFGISETTSRIAGAFLAWLTLLILLVSVGRHYGQRVSLWTGLVAVTTPIFVVQARSVVGETDAILALTLVGVALLEQARGSSARRVWSLLAAGLVVGFLAKGLTMLLMLAALATTVAVVMGSREWRDWAPAVVLILCLGAAAAAVLTSPPDGFAGQFRFTQKIFTAGPTAYDRNFDWAIKRIGFGSLPWSAFYVLALGSLVARVARDRCRSSLVIVAWFLVPTLAAMGMLKDFNQALWHGAPAAALAVGIWLENTRRHGRADHLAGFLVLIMTVILLRELGKSPQPLVDILAFDPPFADKAGHRFPEQVQLAGWIRAGTMALVGVALIHLLSLVKTARSTLTFARQDMAHAVIMACATLLVPVTWFAQVLHKHAVGLGQPAARALSVEQRAFPQQFLLRSLDPMVLVMLCILVLVLGVLLCRFVWPRLGRMLARRAARFSPPSMARSHRWAMGAWALLGPTMVLSVTWPEGYWTETLLHPAAGGLLVGAVVAAGYAYRVSGSARDAALTLLGIGGLALGTRLARDGDLAHGGSVALTLLGCVAYGLALVPRLWESGPRFARLSGRLCAGGLVLLVAPLAHRWIVLEPTLFPDTAEGLLPLLVWEVPMALVAVGVVLTANRRLGSATRLRLASLAGHLERGPVAVGALGLAAVVLTAGLLVSFQPTMAHHVSQKHILDTYRAAEDLGSREIGDRLFKHGAFGATGRGESNFYTAPIPEIRDRATALRILLGEHDQTASVDTSEGTEVRTVPAWDPANDTDGDGQRDHPALRGVATAARSGRLEDDSQQWTPGALAAHVVIDTNGRTWPIRTNDITSLTLQGPGQPSFTAARPERNAYAIDLATMANSRATSQQPARSYLLLPAESFSDINHAFRKLAKGRHIPVVDGRSARVLLAASWMGDGEAQQNRYALHTLTRAEFDSLGDPSVRAHWANFDDTIKVLGYRLDEEMVSKGGSFVLTTYFEVLKDMRKSYKIFLHVDQSGNRIHGDHWPLNLKTGEAGKQCVGCYRSDHWMKGDVVFDVYEGDVPIATPSGAHEIWMGLYAPGGGDKRLPIKTWDRRNVRHDGHNRVRLGVLQVR